MSIQPCGRRTGKTRSVEEAYERFTYGFDGNPCGCGVGILFGRRADGVVGILRQDDVKCAAHDTVVGEVVVVRELS